MFTSWTSNSIWKLTIVICFEIKVIHYDIYDISSKNNQVLIKTDLLCQGASWYNSVMICMQWECSNYQISFIVIDLFTWFLFFYLSGRFAPWGLLEYVWLKYYIFLSLHTTSQGFQLNLIYFTCLRHVGSVWECLNLDYKTWNCPRPIRELALL